MLTILHNDIFDYHVQIHLFNPRWLLGYYQASCCKNGQLVCTVKKLSDPHFQIEQKLSYLV